MRQKVRHKPKIEFVEIRRGHVVQGDGDLFLQEIVRTANQNLEKDVEEVKQHAIAKYCLKRGKKKGVR